VLELAIQRLEICYRRTWRIVAWEIEVAMAGRSDTGFLEGKG
jgi:hypothetical protein